MEFYNSGVTTIEQQIFGLASSGFVISGYLGSSNYSIGMWPNNGSYASSSGFNGFYTSTLVSPSQNDVWAMAVDFGAGLIWLARNNVWSDGSNPVQGALPIASFTPGTVGALFAAMSFNSAGGGVWTIQSASAQQKYLPPIGFSAWDGGPVTPAFTGNIFYFLDSNALGPNFYGSLQAGGSAPSTAVSTRLSWVPGATAAPKFFRASCGASAAATTNSTTSYIDAITYPHRGTGITNTTAADCFISPAAMTGVFAGGNWNFQFNYQSNGGGNLSLSVKVRVFACRLASGAQDGNGIGNRELTALNRTVTPEFGVTGAMTTAGTNYPVTITWAAPSLTLYNEYLFFQFEAHVQTAGVAGQTANLVVGGGSYIATPNWTVNTDPLAGRHWVQGALWNGGTQNPATPRLQ